jgi:opacity protein-like surface antigen
MRRILLLAGLLTLVAAPAAAADTLLPPKGKVYTGVTGGQSVGSFESQVGKHPSVFGFFTW